jgi:hypothetical protein
MVTVTHVDLFEKAIEQVERQHNLQWNSGMKEQFVKDLKREIENVNGRFRYRGNGAQINMEEVVTQRLQKGVYVRTRPGVKEKYVGPWKSRDEDTKKQHSNFTKTYLKKLLDHEQIKFLPGYEEKALEIIADNFLVGDDEEKGIVFQRVIDSEVGAIVGGPKFDIDGLLNNLSLTAWVDGTLTEVLKAEKVAKQKQMAASFAQSGSKSAIEDMARKIDSVERRNLKTGKNLPQFGKDQLESEFKKYHELNSDDPGQANIKTRISLGRVDDLMDIKMEARNFKVDETPTIHEGF